MMAELLRKVTAKAMEKTRDSGCLYCALEILRFRDGGEERGRVKIKTTAK
jgi:hypothetical protein